MPSIPRLRDLGGEDELVVTQALGVVLDIERLHGVVYLVVLIHQVALEIPDVERPAGTGLSTNTA